MYICIFIVVVFYPGSQMVMILIFNGHGPNLHNTNVKTSTFNRQQHYFAASIFLKSGTSKQVIIIYKTQSKGLALNIVTSGTYSCLFIK